MSAAPPTPPAAPEDPLGVAAAILAHEKETRRQLRDAVCEQRRRKVSWMRIARRLWRLMGNTYDKVEVRRLRDRVRQRVCGCSGRRRPTRVVRVTEYAPAARG